MKKFASYVAIAAAVLFSASCEKEAARVEVAPALKPMSFLASTDKDIKTKTQLNDHAVTWSANETIYVFDGFTPRVFQNAEAGSKVTFTGMVENTDASKFYAVYPSGTIKESAGKKVVSTMIPYLQSATSSSFAEGANAAVAVSTPAAGNSALQFKNIGAVVKIQVTDSDVRKIKLESLGTKKMSGHVDVTFESDDSFASTVTSGINYVILDGGSSNLDPSAVYYFTIAAQNYSEGFRVSLVRADGSYASFRRTEALDLDRNGLVDFGVIPAVTNWKVGGFGWDKVTAVNQMTNGDYLIISYDDAYYLANDRISGTSKPVANSISKDTEGNIIVNDSMIWVGEVDGTEFHFKSKADESWFLWGASDNAGIRVTNTYTASGANKNWKFVANNDYGVIAYAYATKYLATYGTQDWRNYSSVTTDNRAANFWKKNSTGISLSIPSEDDVFSITEQLPASNSVAYCDAEATFKVTSTIPWSISADQSFVSFATTKSSETVTNVTVSFEDNNADGAVERNATVSITPLSGKGFSAHDIEYTQRIYVPEITITKTSGLQASTTDTAMDEYISYRNSAGNSYSDPIRIYSGNTFTITASNGAKIKKVELTASDSSYNTVVKNAVVKDASGTTLSSNGTGPSYYWTKPEGTTSVTFKPSAQARLSSISVTYSL